MVQTLGLTKKLWNKKYARLWDKNIMRRKKKFSEHGEEQVIDCVFSKFPPKHKYFVDVGAYGALSSNTWKLMKQGWRGLMIERDRNQAVELATTTDVEFRWETVTPQNLEDILMREGVKFDFDFLSVDVDSYEYEIWKNLSVYKPKLVCIEVNQKEQDFEVIDYDPSFSVHPDAVNGYGGATIGLMNRLADEKGYDYLCWDVSNAFYIRR